MGHLGTLTIARQPRGDAVIRSDGSSGSAKSDALSLGQKAIGILITAAGSLKIVDGEGFDQTYADGDLAKNVWHPIQIKKVYATGTTLADTGFRLGFSGVLCLSLQATDTAPGSAARAGSGRLRLPPIWGSGWKRFRPLRRVPSSGPMRG